MYPAELEIKNTTEHHFCFLPRFTTVDWGGGGMVNFTLRSTTNEMISISTSQTFRSWVIVFHLRRPMAFLSFNLYDTPGLAPRMNVLFWGPGDFPVGNSNRDTSLNAWSRHSWSFMVDTGILFSNMKSPLLRMLDDILTLNQQWLPNW